MAKIERWQLSIKPTEEGAWNGKMSVEFDRNDLKIITDALSCAEMEGYIDTSDMEYMFDKLNIDKGW